MSRDDRRGGELQSPSRPQPWVQPSVLRRAHGVVCFRLCESTIVPPRSFLRKERIIYFVLYWQVVGYPLVPGGRMAHNFVFDF